MNELTVGLAGLGGLVLVAVVVHGAWKTRHMAPRQAGTTEAADTPADPRIDPSLDTSLSDLAALSSEIPALALSERRAVLDPLIDSMATIALEAAVPGEAAAAAMPATRRAGSKPFAIEGLNETTQTWEVPQAGRRYREFQAGVQLANRMGALNEIEYSEFVMKARAFADALGGEPDFAEMLHEVARARELDQFAALHDAQLGFVLRPLSAAWSPGFVQQHAARLGFVPGVIPGRMVLPAAVSGDPPVLGLVFDPQAAMAEDPTQAAVREVILSLDVPQVPRAEQPFTRLCDAATLLAQAMDGTVTDDAAQPITPQAMAQIGTDLERLYDTLEARELSAGSPLARRLFS